MTTQKNWITFLEKDHAIKTEVWKKYGLHFDDYFLYLPYKTTDGSLLYNKKRKEPTFVGEKKYIYPPGSKAMLYPHFDISSNDTWILTEGELDALTLESYGFNAVTTGSATSFKKELTVHFKNKTVYVCFDNDEQGIKGALRTAQMIAAEAYKVFIVDIPKKRKIKDIGNYFKAGHTAGDFSKLLSKAKVFEPGENDSQIQHDSLRQFHPALSIDSERQEIISCFASITVSIDKKKIENNEFITVIQSNTPSWHLNRTEIKKRCLFPRVIPFFNNHSRYSPEILKAIKNNRCCDHRDCRDYSKDIDVIDPYKDVYMPIKGVIEKLVDLQNPHQSSVIALWIMGTYLFPIFEAYPYLYFGGMRGSGKTKMLDILQHLVFNPEATANCSTSSLFRTIERNLSTILLDEGERLTGREKDADLRLLFNAGYKKSMSVVTRTNKDTLQPERFNVYSPKAIGSINPLDATLASRCISFIMLRTMNKEKGKKRVDEHVAPWQTLRDNLYRFLFNHGLCIAHIYTTTEDFASELLNRDNELYTPLLAIATYVDYYVENAQEKITPAIIKFALETIEDEEELDDWTAWVLEAINDLVTQHKAYQVNDIKNKITENRIDDDLTDRLTNRWIGGCLRRFDLKRGKPTRVGKTYIISRGQVENLKRRYYPYLEGNNGHNRHQNQEGGDKNEQQNTV